MVGHGLDLGAFAFQLDETFTLEQLAGALEEGEDSLDLELQLEEVAAEQVERVAGEWQLRHHGAWEAGVRPH